MVHIQETIINPDLTVNMLIAHKDRVIRLHSSRPKAEAEKILAQLSHNSPAYIIGGLGLGYLLEYILQKTRGICLIYEPISPIFDTALKLRPELQNLLNNPRVILARDFPTLIQAIQDYKLNDISFSIHRPYNDLFPKQFSEIKEHIATGIRKYEVGNATLLRFGKVWAKNIFRNMHRYFESLKLISFKAQGKNKAAIIIGAGPSLEEALPLLKKYQNHAFLIACDTALPMLHQYQINPDFVVTVDPQEKNSLYLRYVSHKDHFLVADPSVHNSTFEGYKNDKIILMDSIFPLYQPLEEFWGACGLLASGGSVSTSAFDLARKLEANPIIMVGQDLSFSKRKTHSTGNILSEFSRVIHHRLNSFHQTQALTTYPPHSQQIKGRSPHARVHADARFMLFRDWFSNEIPKTNAKVIVAGMEGAFLEGAIHLPIDEAFTYLPNSINKMILLPKQVISNDLYLDFLKETITTTNTLIPICGQILSTIKKAVKNNNLDLALKESSLLQDLLSSHQKISLLISISMQDAVQAALNISPQTSPKEHLQILLNITQDTFYGLKNLNHSIKKASHFIKQ